MPLYLGGTTVQSGTITPAGSTFTLASTQGAATGYVTKGTTVAFSAQGSWSGAYSNGWQYPNNTGWAGAANWQILTGARTGWGVDAQRGSGFSTSTGRFTAPVAGYYVFHKNLYMLNNLGTPYNTGAGYAHPQFAKNGSLGWNNGYTPYKIYMHGAAGGNFGANEGHVDGITGSAVMYLAAGDYVEIWVYIHSNDTRIYPPYSAFWGALIS